MELDEPPESYTAPVTRESRAAATAPHAAAAAGAGSGAKRAAAAAREAVAAAEELAGVAIRHEHNNRRRFLAAAATAGRGGGAGSSAAAAAGREEATLRHRLLHTVRGIALSAGEGAVGGGGAAARRGGAGGAAALLGSEGASPGALLLLWQPAAPAGGGNSSTSSSSSSSSGYVRVFDDAAARLMWSPWTHPGMAAQAWHAFMGRWLAASPQGAEGLLQSLRTMWREGSPGDSAAACWAASGLASSGALSEGQMGEAIGELCRLVKAGGGGGGVSSSSAAASSVIQAAAAAAARILPAVHPADWQSREAVVGALRALLLAWGAEGGDGAPAGAGGAVRAAAAEALAFAACHSVRLGSQQGSSSSGADERGLALACSCMGLLLALLAALQPAEAPAVHHLAEQLPDDLRRLIDFRSAAVPDLDLATICDDDPWLLAALRRGAVAIAAALHETRPVPALLQALQADAARLAAAALVGPMQSGGGTAASPEAHAAALAALTALTDAALAGLDALPSGPEAAQAALATLSAAARSPTINGWQGGAAALGWARVAAALLQRGLLPGAADAAAPDAATAEGAAQPVESLSALCGGRPLPEATATEGAGVTGGHRGAATWALRCGAAAGLAALLGADVDAGAFGAGLGPGALVAWALAWLASMHGWMMQ
jgi:hypothetical protein